MLFSHFLFAYSNKCMLSWLNKIKPFLDAYHAPYNRNHRYWTGLLLLVHCALSLTFALNALGSDSVNLIAITSVTACLIAWLRWKIYVKLFFSFSTCAYFQQLLIMSRISVAVRLALPCLHFCWNCINNIGLYCCLPYLYSAQSYCNLEVNPWQTGTVCEKR